MYRNQLFQIINYKKRVNLRFNKLMFNTCTATKIDKIFFFLISDSLCKNGT